MENHNNIEITKFDLSAFGGITNDQENTNARAE